MENTSSETTTPCRPHKRRGISCRFGAIVGLQFLTEAAFGFMSPVIYILMTEYFARLHRGGLPIDCGIHPHDESCTDGSRQAAWLSSLFSAMGSVCNFILAPMLGQASDIHGRKPFLVLSQLARVGTPFSVMHFTQPEGSITPYFVLRLIDYGFGWVFGCTIAIAQYSFCMTSNTALCMLFYVRTAGVMSASVADVVAPEDRAAAFGVLFASQSVGYCMTAFIAPFFSRDTILQIAAGLFVARVLWAMLVLPETLPVRTTVNKTRWVMESPISSISILFRNQLFLRLTCLIALTSFVMNGTFQIQSFYLNTIVAFDVKDFGNLMLLGGVLSLVGQGLLLKPLVICFKEKGVIIIAMICYFLKNVGFAGTAFYPDKWVVYASSIPGSLGDLSFPAITALKSINVSEKEQGRLQGAIYGARSVFDALGPIIFSTLYAAMTPQSLWSQALPFVVASFINFVGIGIALSLPAGKTSPPPKIAAVPVALPSPTCGESPSSSTVYFETDDDNETEDGDNDSQTVYASLDDEKFLVEPLLGV